MASPQDSIQKALAENREKNPREFLATLGDDAPRPRHKRTLTKPTPIQDTPGPKPMSPVGFVENVLNNAWDITKGFINLFPTVIKSGAEVFGDPEGMALLMQNPQHLVQAFRDTGAHLKDAILHPYEKHGFRVLYEEPLTPVLDAMTVLTLGGGAIAKGGRLAGSAKMFEAGNRIASIPGQIGQAVTRAPLKAVGINPETRMNFLRYRRQEQAGAKLEAGLRREKVLAGSEKLADAEAAALEKFILEGGTKAELAVHPNAARVYAGLDDWLKAERELELGPKGRALLTDKQMENRVIQEFSERRGVDFATGKQLYDALELKPLYAPAIRESAGHFSFQNAFLEPSVIRKGKVGFLEKFSSAKGAAAIKTRISRAIDDFYSSRASLRLVDRVIQTPGYAKAVKAGDQSLGELLPSGGIFQKYFTDRARSRSLFYGDLEAQHGKARAAQLVSSDLPTQKALNQAVNIAIPDPTLRKLIAREFRTVGGDVGSFIRIYDKLTDLFRVSATKLSPRWYTGNIVGDALLASLAGSQWPLAKRLIEQNALPRLLKSGKFGQAAETGNRLNLLSDFVGSVDDTARAGIFSKAVADNLQKTAMRFASSEEFLRMVKDISLAPDELADIMVRNQQLGEHVSRGSRAIQRLNAEIAKDQKKLATLTTRFQNPNKYKDFHSIGREQQAIRDRLDILTETRDAAVADLTRNAMAREIDRIPELARKAEIAEQAMDRANLFLGEYLGLGPIERGVFRRLIPFYPWMKAMSKLAFTFPFVAPGKAFFWHRYAAAMTDMMGDPELPEWMAAYAPVFMRQNGDTVWARFTSLSPFGSLRTEKFGEVPVPSIVAFWRSNPWLSAGYRLVGGKDIWNAEAVPYGEPLVAINDGEVYKFNEKGKLERVIPQAPLVRTLAHMFSVVQLGDQLISNYDVRKGKPVLNSDGTVKYPIELPRRLMDAFGLKVMERDKDQAMAQERRRVQLALEELKRDYKRADPEGRKYIEGIFEDYQRGEYRRIAGNK